MSVKLIPAYGPGRCQRCGHRVIDHTVAVPPLARGSTRCLWSDKHGNSCRCADYTSDTRYMDIWPEELL